ncbi:hypothetical protein A9K55_001892 [Cordyceps militaris]|uniref:DUF7924 domain-containing protein n=1 Tax=Cordyceps militaris TaxID=73501 RepID=A0A2H4SSC5_CORMI|nr:hypothetical protein A9K55_001892 [Cordyceps militaris]
MDEPASREASKEASQGLASIIKKDGAQNHEQDPEKPQRGPLSSSKRPCPAPAAADNHPTNDAKDPLPPDLLVSGWLDDVYPAKRRRRFSATSTGLVFGSEKSRQDRQDRQDNQEGQYNQYGAQRARASSEPIAPRDPTGGMSLAKPPTTASSPQSPRSSSASRPRSSSPGADSAESSTTRTSAKLVENKDYRLNNLDSNGIQVRVMDSPLPAAVQAVVESLGLQEPPPEPTTSDLKDVRSIRAHNDGLCKPIEKIICRTFDECLFPLKDLDNTASLLLRSDDIELTPALLSTNFPSEQPRKLDELEIPRQKLSKPKPDIIYGYRYEAFRPDVRYLLRSALGNLAEANTALMVMPFLLVELKGEGGGLWACANQCIGGSVACVNIVRYLNAQLRARQQDLFNSAIFSLAMNGEHATLFVTWRPDPNVDLDVSPGAEYYTQRLFHFAFQQTDQYLIYQRCIRRILEWGMGKRRDAAITAFTLCASKKRKERGEGGIPEETSVQAKKNSWQANEKAGRAK